MPERMRPWPTFSGKDAVYYIEALRTVHEWLEEAARITHEFLVDRGLPDTAVEVTAMVRALKERVR